MISRNALCYYYVVFGSFFVSLKFTCFFNKIPKKKKKKQKHSNPIIPFADMEPQNL